MKTHATWLVQVRHTCLHLTPRPIRSKHTADSSETLREHVFMVQTLSTGLLWEHPKRICDSGQYLFPINSLFVFHFVVIKFMTIKLLYSIHQVNSTATATSDWIHWSKGRRVHQTLNRKTEMKYFKFFQLSVFQHRPPLLHVSIQT